MGEFIDTIQKTIDLQILTCLIGMGENMRGFFRKDGVVFLVECLQKPICVNPKHKYPCTPFLRGLVTGIHQFQISYNVEENVKYAEPVLEFIKIR